MPLPKVAAAWVYVTVALPVFQLTVGVYIGMNGGGAGTYSKAACSAAFLTGTVTVLALAAAEFTGQMAGSVIFLLVSCVAAFGFGLTLGVWVYEDRRNCWEATHQQGDIESFSTRGALPTEKEELAEEVMAECEVKELYASCQPARSQEDVSDIDNALNVFITKHDLDPVIFKSREWKAVVKALSRVSQTDPALKEAGDSEYTDSN
jgi:hypothetical protein